MRLAFAIAVLVFSSLWARATPPQPPKPPQMSSKMAKGAMSDEDMQLEGEKRFRTNCGRCHQAPHKFPPRMMATIVRHMRVRSMITDDDMKYILRYMTQ